MGHANLLNMTLSKAQHVSVDCRCAGHLSRAHQQLMPYSLVSK